MSSQVEIPEQGGSKVRPAMQLPEGMQQQLDVWWQPNGQGTL